MAWYPVLFNRVRGTLCRLHGARSASLAAKTYAFRSFDEIEAWYFYSSFYHRFISAYAFINFIFG